MDSIFEMIDNLRKKHPVIQNITNYVTINDCANILLACGASPVMTDDVGDSADVAAVSDGLTLNIGTLNTPIINSMISAGKVANRLGHPIVFDPVGVGISKIRTETVYEIIKKLNITVIRGNISELCYLADQSEIPIGVDAVSENHDFYKISEILKKLSHQLDTVIVATGPIDIITDGDSVCFCKNGDPYMKKVTGTGCQISSVITAFAASNSPIFESAVAAVCSYGICGEIARLRMCGYDGNASYRNYIIDAMCNLNCENFKQMAKYEIS